MKNKNRDKIYKFYLAFNNISLGSSFIVPLIVGILYLIIDRPYACDPLNPLLIWLLICATSVISFRLTKEILDKNNLLKDDD
jgi:uncharacterized membrane-anchored protein